MDLAQNIVLILLVAYLAFREVEARRTAAEPTTRRKAAATLLLERLGPPVPGEKPGRALLRAHLAGKR